jgi:sulfhydrogenase subunit beta (sulfur reductase)
VFDNADANDTSRHDTVATLSIGSVVVLGVDDLAILITRLSESGYEVKGPVVRSGAIVPGVLGRVDDLPKGVHDEQAPGTYRLVHGEDSRLFDWAVGPSGWKPEFFPPHDEVWRARIGDGNVQMVQIRDAQRPLAVVGARPCEMAALKVLDRVFIEGAYRDSRYAERRENAFIAVVECSSPAATCFCDSMSTGPNIEAGFDLALTELDNDKGHRFLARVGSPRALGVLEGMATAPATQDDFSAREALLDGSRRRMVRHLDVDPLAGLLARNLEHPRWAEVAERCLSCGNCTLVCPTCFCSDVRDATDLDGDVVRQRTWSSCFSVDHSYLHGGAVRPTTQSRYRQWMTHKLSSWWDQFDTTGCVGCGRCIAWCPVGIDITEEASAIVRSDGATVVASSSVRSPS